MMRRYVLSLLGLLAVFLIAAAGVSWFGLDQCPMSDRNVCGIYHFQKAKLAAAPETIDLMMLGDSSLGNAVDGKQMGALVGRSTVNLALSGGSMGLGANYIQLQDALKDHRIRNLVIMFTPAGFRHRFRLAAEGYVFTTGGDLRRAAVSPTVFFRSLLALSRMLFDIRSLSAGARRLAFGTETIGDCTGCDQLGYPRQSFLEAQLGAILFMAAGILFAGWLSDRLLDPRRVLIWGCLGTIAAGALLAPLVGSGQIGGVFLFLALALLTMGFVYGPLGAWLPGLFPPQVRYTGTSLAFNVGGIIGGGLTPAIAQVLAEHGGLTSVGVYLAGAAVLSLIGLLLASRFTFSAEALAQPGL